MDVVSRRLNYFLPDGRGWDAVGGVKGIPSTADTWLPMGLMPNTTYYYRIQAANSAGNSLWSPVVSLTTLATPPDVGYYQVSLGADTYIAGGYDDVMYAQDSSQAITADSWQQAMLLGASGGAENLSLGQTVIIGGFVQAAGGAGYSGNSYGFTITTGTTPCLAFNDTTQSYYYNQNQIDHCQDPSWLEFSVTLTDSSNSANTLTQAAGAADGEFALNGDPSTGEAAFTVDVSSLQFGGPAYPSPGPDIIWQVSGATATPADGDFGTTANPQITLDPTNNYIFTLTAGVPLYSGSTTIDPAKPVATVNIDVLHGSSISIGYIGGTNSSNGTLEGEKTLAAGQFFLKGYMLDLKAPAAQPGTKTTWSVAKVGGGNAPAGTFHAAGDWYGYQTTIPAATVTGPVAYWTSDTGGAITDQYVISCTYTPVGAQAPVTITRTIASRPLKPTRTMASQPNADVDMLQRLMIQDFFIDKGRLSQYNIGEYQDAAQTLYTCTNLGGGKYSPVAEEVKNYEQFSMNTANPSTTLDLATLQSMWGMFTQIWQASHSLSQGEIGNGVTSSDPNYGAANIGWVATAVRNLGSAGKTMVPAGNLTGTNGGPVTVTDMQILNAWAQNETKQRQSYAQAVPIAFEDLDVDIEGSLATHYYTVDGLGFMQVQWYNDIQNGKTYNLMLPEENLECGAFIVAGYVADPNNPGNKPGGSANEALAYAAYRYNQGNYGVNGALTANGKKYVEDLFRVLGLAVPTGF